MRENELSGDPRVSPKLESLLTDYSFEVLSAALFRGLFRVCSVLLAAKHHLIVELLLGPEQCLLHLGNVDKGPHENRVIGEELLKLRDTSRR